MAISSIQMFQNNGSNSIEGLLRAGPQAISEIMNQAIQIGRQMSDKQLSQEKDLLNMRQQENAMMQRRAENAQQLFTDTMKFDRAVGQDNRDYAANRSDRAFDQNRQTANDLFSQRMQERRLGLSEQRMSAVGAEDEAERKRKAQQLLDFENRYGGEPALPGAEATNATPTEEIIPTSTDNPRVDALTTQINKGKEDLGMLTSRTAYPFRERFETRIAELESERAALSKTPKGTVPEVRTLPPSASTVLFPEEGDTMLPPRNDLASVEAKLEMLEKPPEDASEKALTNYFEEKSLLEQRRKELIATDKTDAPKADKGVSPTKLNSMMKTVEDLEAFAPQSKAIALKYGSFEKAEALAATDEKVKAEVEAAKQFDANRFNSEKEAALSAKDENDYVEKAYDITTAIREKRRKFYREVVGVFGGGSTTTGTGTGAVDSIPGI